MKKMQYKVELSYDAENDFDKSYEYYTRISQKIADNFYKQINNNLEKIRQEPLVYPKIFKSIRKYVISENQFIIYYQIKTGSIRIIAIFHSSRSPEIWKNRIDIFPIC